MNQIRGKQFRGSGVALVTPFTESGEVDYNGLRKLVTHVTEGGINYLVVLGTTGESATLTADEKKQVIQTVIDQNAGKLPVVLGIGGNNTAAVIDAIKAQDFTGIDAILSVSPYYNKPTQEGIYQHYKAIATSTEMPIILYNVPGRTSSNISADTTLRLANDFDNVIAVKEASGDMEQIMKISKDRPEGFLLISGDDNLTYPMIAVGGDGVISVSGQGYPQIFSAMVTEALEGNFATALPKHNELFEVTQLLFAEGNPGGIKVALEAQGICGAAVRLPLWPISEHLALEIVKHTKRIQNL